MKTPPASRTWPPPSVGPGKGGGYTRAVKLLLGIDVGTSGTKAVLLRVDDGSAVAQATEEYPVAVPREGWSEQHPADWWAAAAKATRDSLGKVAASGASAEVVAVGLSGQMHGSVLLPRGAAEGGEAAAREGAVVRLAILWNDQRTGRECEEIEAAAGGRAALVRACGNAALTGFTVPKLLWLRRHEPEAWARVGTVLLPKDYVRWRLTGELATDVGDASGTLVFDPAARAWNRDLMARLGLDAGLWPRVIESTAIAGRVSAWAARETGLAEGTLVVAGSGDNMCGAVGVGVVKPGMVLAALGTSGVVLVHADRPVRDEVGPGPSGRMHGMAAATGLDGWCLTGCMLSAAGALRWARSVLAPGVRYADVLAEAEAVPAGCEGLVFLPYLTGERCPYPDPTARGGWIGLTSRHGRGHLVRAVLEGVTFGMGQIVNLARSLGAPVNSVRVTGGGNRSALWRQMQADVYGVTVESAGDEDAGSAAGAAILAGVGAGVWASVQEACERTISVRERLDPGFDAVRYEAPRDVYARLYGDLKPAMAALGKGTGIHHRDTEAQRKH